MIFYDQLGCGRSDRPDDTSLWKIERFVDELARVRKALNLKKVHILGHSWGASLAVDYMLAKPSPLGVESLILASPFLSASRYMKDVEKHRSALSEDIQEILIKHEKSGTFDSREYTNAVHVYYQRHVYRSRGPDKNIRAATRGSNDKIYELLWGPHESSMARGLSRTMNVRTGFMRSKSQHFLPAAVMMVSLPKQRSGSKAWLKAGNWRSLEKAPIWRSMKNRSDLSGSSATFKKCGKEIQIKIKQETSYQAKKTS